MIRPREVLALASPLSRIDLNLLIPLNALLIEQNVTRAAERTSVTQPSMSAALAKLRRHFNDPLLVRDGRALVLTPLAESLQKPVTALLIAAREVLTVGRSFEPAVDHRSFTIAACDYDASVLIHPAIRGMHADAPNVRINVQNVQNDIMDGLRNMRYDLVICSLQLPLPGLLEFPHAALSHDETIVVADQDNHTIQEPLTAEALAATPAVQVSASGRGKTAIDIALDELGLAQSTVVTVDSFTVALRLISGTDLVTVTQRRLFEQVRSAYGLREVPLAISGSTMTQAMFWHPRHVREPAHQWLRGRLLDVVRDL